MATDFIGTTMTSNLIPLAKALSFILGDVKENPAVVELSLRDARGCVLARSQTATSNVPAFDNSAMDGYAVNCSDLDQPGCKLPVSQIIAAGHPGTTLEKATAARIFTGAPIPAGADAVVIQENTNSDADSVSIMQLPKPGENIRLKGHDVAMGEVILNAGHRLRAQDLGLLASLGIASVEVKQPLKVAIINTGDEVVAPGLPLKPGQLYDSNSFTLEGLLAGIGMQVIKLGIVDDSLENTRKALAQAAAQADCIITTGGVSVGDEDHVRQAVEELGQLALWKLAIKPGKPFSYGRIRDVPFFGLPGNPVAVFVTFVMLARPYMLTMQGATQANAPMIGVKSGFAVERAGTRLEFLRVRLVTDNQGGQMLEAFANQGSSLMTSLAWADGLAEIPQGKTVSIGQLLNFIPFSGIL